MILATVLRIDERGPGLKQEDQVGDVVAWAGVALVALRRVHGGFSMEESSPVR